MTDGLKDIEKRKKTHKKGLGLCVMVTDSYWHSVHKRSGWRKTEKDGDQGA